MTRLVRLSEGLPSDTRTSDVWKVAEYRRDRRRSESVALAMSICEAVRINLSGGSTSDVLRPFYTEAEWDRMREEAAEARQRMAEEQQIAKLRRLSREWQKN
ncbi:MAG: hypothetical protein ACI381_07340 [Candidatus Methanomethylophilaceae archaeon]